jgi:hypothetical protein
MTDILKWHVVNRFNDIKVVSFASRSVAEAYAKARNAQPHVIDNPWFVSQV